jgi:hypothetical protein
MTTIKTPSPMLEMTIAVPNVAATILLINARQRVTAITHMTMSLTHSCIARAGFVASKEVTNNVLHRIANTPISFSSFVVGQLRPDARYKAIQRDRIAGRKIDDSM